LISGVPPQSIYTHPEEQAYMLEHSIRPEDVTVAREWVLPTAQGQSWSLRRIAEIFDALPDGEGYRDGGKETQQLDMKDGKQRIGKRLEYEKKKKGEKAWGGKRVLLAMVNKAMGGDGTVVYYVILEGIVKPRQN